MSAQRADAWARLESGIERLSDTAEEAIALALAPEALAHKALDHLLRRLEETPPKGSLPHGGGGLTADGRGTGPDKDAEGNRLCRLIDAALHCRFGVEDSGLGEGAAKLVQQPSRTPWLRNPFGKINALTGRLRDTRQGLGYLDHALASLCASGEAGGAVVQAALEEVLAGGVDAVPAKKLSTLLDRLASVLEDHHGAVHDPAARRVLETLGQGKKRSVTQGKAQALSARPTAHERPPPEIVAVAALIV